MEKNNLLSHEVVMASSDKTTNNFISKMKKEGRLVKIATKIYTTNLNDTPENIIRGNLFFILGELFPDAVMSHRSAFECQLTRKDNPEKLINAIQRVRLFSHHLHGDNFEQMRDYMERCNAFKEEDEYILRF
ncbi:MAG: hypothetical protein IJ160_11420 [Muribaculaceae bacterium]|nr:hypothetical protein [Muribaculaceae bacterium]